MLSLSLGIGSALASETFRGSSRQHIGASSAIPHVRGDLSYQPAKVPSYQGLRADMSIQADDPGAINNLYTGAVWSPTTNADGTVTWERTSLPTGPVYTGYFNASGKWIIDPKLNSDGTWTNPLTGAIWQPGPDEPEGATPGGDWNRVSLPTGPVYTGIYTGDGSGTWTNPHTGEIYSLSGDLTNSLSNPYTGAVWSPTTNADGTVTWARISFPTGPVYTGIYTGDGSGTWTNPYADAVWRPMPNTYGPVNERRHSLNNPVRNESWVQNGDGSWINVF